MADTTEARRLADESDITELVRMDVETAKAAGLSVMRLKHEEASHLLSTIDSLRAEVAVLQMACSRWEQALEHGAGRIREAEAEADSLRAQVEALRADAERYQRWREEVVTAFCDTKLLKAVGDALDPADVDAAIDAARSQEAAG